MGFESFPFVIGWELTLACNLRCRHCGSSAGRPRDEELTLEEAMAICGQLPDLFVQEVNFTGGEPLMSPHCFDIAECLGKEGINTKILTNGLLLDQQTISRIQDAGICAIGISLDGLELVHDKIREHSGLFNHLRKTFPLILGANMPLTVITTVNSWNVRQLPSLCRFLMSEGVQNWQIQPIFHFGRANQARELILSDEEYMLMGDFFQQWSPRAATAGLAIVPGDSFGYLCDWDNRSPPWRGCPAGLFSCGITSDGRVKGCLSLPDDEVEGDLRRKDLWDIWFHSDSFAYTRHYAAEELGPFCNSCQVAEQCRGGCSAMSLGASGQFHNDPYCFRRIEGLDILNKSRVGEGKGAGLNGTCLSFLG